MKQRKKSKAKQAYNLGTTYKNNNNKKKKKIAQNASHSGEKK